MTLAKILGKVEDTVFDDSEIAEKANSLSRAFDFSLPRLPPQDSCVASNVFPELSHSMDEVIGFFGNSGQDQEDSLEPLPLFPLVNNNMKRELQHHDAPAARPLKKIKTSMKNALPVAPEDSEDEANNCFRLYQAEQWTQRFEELCDFAKDHGHCQVPHTFQKYPALARWVKRQRYQYKLRVENKSHTMTDDRIHILEKIGFVWDSHEAAWEERRVELARYGNTFGHCNVPSNFPLNKKLAVWVKRQRRQYKFFCLKKPSSMNPNRIALLESMGFEWELRFRGEAKKN